MRFVISMDTAKLRIKVDQLLRSRGFQTEVVDKPQRLIEDERWKLPIIVETGRDAARLCMIVYEMHRRTSEPAIIAVIDPALVRDNPSLCFWVIGGQRALSASVQISEIDTALPEFAKRIAASER